MSSLQHDTSHNVLFNDQSTTDYSFPSRQGHPESSLDYVYCLIHYIFNYSKAQHSNKSCWEMLSLHESFMRGVKIFCSTISLSFSLQPQIRYPLSSFHNRDY
mmetsp:Transcript_1544/g.2209  ORF Transcript_1544/g.2209 Transcript_1544/m.2209 type:complete len:102 (+) Transcript_1544:41-346(+)